MLMKFMKNFSEEERIYCERILRPLQSASVGEEGFAVLWRYLSWLKLSVLTIPIN